MSDGNNSEYVDAKKASCYEDLRQQYCPKKVRVVFLAESAPAPGDTEPRFFYAPTLSAYDNLFRGLMLSLYGADKTRLRGRKTEWLERFQADGFWLLDVAPRPVNKLTRRERRKVLESDAPEGVSQVIAVGPEKGVVICHGGTFRVMAPKLLQARIRLLHVKPIPFPLGNHRSKFVAEVTAVLTTAGITVL